ncbi:hypothetical protein PGIGA_G00120610 [Pangasianodon gigas]|uniref:Uncharacterized protein n=1 Tax=Pangasianodon gigas TaxID=30993 RepID=A0ACC5XGL5_PANGG|nr:hypothetical protein [Pangasianodon gigas]
MVTVKTSCFLSRDTPRLPIGGSFGLGVVERRWRRVAVFSKRHLEAEEAAEAPGWDQDLRYRVEEDRAWLLERLQEGWDPRGRRIQCTVPRCLGLDTR